MARRITLAWSAAASLSRSRQIQFFSGDIWLTRCRRHFASGTTGIRGAKEAAPDVLCRLRVRPSGFAQAAARSESMIVEFAGILDNLPLEESETVRAFRALIAPKNNAELDRLAVHARTLTRQHFGRTMRLFAPLY